MTHATILTEIRDQIGLITLNRPEALNALNSQITSEIAAATTANAERLFGLSAAAD